MDETTNHLTYMRIFTTSTLTTLVGFTILCIFLQFGSNRRYLELSAIALQNWSANLERPSVAEMETTVNKANRRILLYDDQVNEQLLYHGMVINKTAAGRILDICDSLLFSALRFAALKKAGLAERAQTAWRAIESSKTDGYWLRHPTCKNSTSRDMIVGVMVALSQKPERYDQHINALLKNIEENNGYLGNGPIYVSYATPQIALGLRMLSADLQIPGSSLPIHVQNGFSTGELSVQVLERGYASHLVALGIWLELELMNTARKYPISALHGSYFSTLIDTFDHVSFKSSRLQWQTHKLVMLDPQNMFFRYLRLKSINAMNPNLAYTMLSELLAMPQFPSDSLPTNCDKKADYLWQRKSQEYKPRAFANCQTTFNGTDFLWMASLLLEEIKDTSRPLSH
jgi:hypothetical protein